VLRTLTLVAIAAGSSVQAADAAHILDIEDRTGKFASFYAHARAKPMDADTRFKLWQDEDGLAAVPPGPDGDTMVRGLLDAAWDRYPALVPKVRALEKAVEATN
jgi:hypothetical protein